MPNFDQTGPAGQGALTGKKQGSCAGNQQTNFIGNERGKGSKCCQNGSGKGRFFHGGNIALSLEEQEKNLETQLKAVRNAKKLSNSSE